MGRLSCIVNGCWWPGDARGHDINYGIDLSFLTHSNLGARKIAWWRLKREHFPRYWPFYEGNPLATGGFPSQRLMTMFSVIYAWTNGWGNNRDVGDLRHGRAHYDVTVLGWKIIYFQCILTHVDFCVQVSTSFFDVAGYPDCGTIFLPSILVSDRQWSLEHLVTSYYVTTIVRKPLLFILPVLATPDKWANYFLMGQIQLARRIKFKVRCQLWSSFLKNWKRDCFLCVFFVIWRYWQA